MIALFMSLACILLHNVHACVCMSSCIAGLYHVMYTNYARNVSRDV